MSGGVDNTRHAQVSIYDLPVLYCVALKAEHISAKELTLHRLYKDPVTLLYERSEN